MGARPIVLSIAGYDPSSGAGITADIKTAAAFGCYAVTCITAFTVQSSQGVYAVEPVRPELVSETLFRLADDVTIAAVRIGMLGSGEVADAVADFLRQCKPPNVVLDPVLRSSSGASLIDAKGLTVIRTTLLPLSDVTTPNLDEAVELTDTSATSSARSWDSALPHIRAMAVKVHGLGCKGVVITGGDLSEANDYLSVEESDTVTEWIFPGTRLAAWATHGTGCAFAMALACGLACGKKLPEALSAAKDFVRHAIEKAYPVGKGIGPMNHLFRMEEHD